jgi:hypothetical protein
MIRVVHPGSRILTFYPSRISDPGVKKAPDPGSATVEKTTYENEKPGQCKENWRTDRKNLKTLVLKTSG